MPTPITVVDAFTDRPFAGNPAAVCVLPGPADERWMANVAREMNLSETAFLHPLPGEALYGLRWFTPTVEVDLCGHATLAAVHVLRETGAFRGVERLRFETRSGELSAISHHGMIWLDFPMLPVNPAPIPEGLDRALGTDVLGVWDTGMDLLAEVRDEVSLRAIVPDLAYIATLPHRGLIVTSLADTRGRDDIPSRHADFVSRFFAPQSGVPEDPVTGSAHCALAPFWGDRLGKPVMTGYQASARGGVVRVDLYRQSRRVHLGGQAITMMRGEIHNEPV